MSVRARNSVHFEACQASLASLSTRIAPSWAHLCQELSSAEVDVGQASAVNVARGVLGQAAVAHFAEAPQPLDDCIS
jgi:hypothetical protein